MTEQQTFALLLGEAAMAVWGDMPRDIQEALFEAAMKGQEADREEFARPSPSNSAIRRSRAEQRNSVLPREFMQAA